MVTKQQKCGLLILIFTMSGASSVWAGNCQTNFSQLARVPGQSSDFARLAVLLNDAHAGRGRELGQLFDLINIERKPAPPIERYALAEQIVAVDSSGGDCADVSSLSAFYNIFRVQNLTPAQESSICLADMTLKIEYARQVAGALQAEVKKVSNRSFALSVIETPLQADSCPEISITLPSSKALEEFKAKYGEQVRGAKVSYGVAAEVPAR